MSEHTANGCLKISKILNNNAVVCIADDNTEKIVMGRGIAFGKKAGDAIDSSRIEKVFTLHSQETSNHFQQIIQNIPVEHILLAERIISHAKQTCRKKLHDSIYITLTDHISAALMRVNEHITLKNPLLPSIRRLYPEEYQFAADALVIIKEATGVSFPEDEAAFLALHFINAELGPDNTKINAIVATAERIAAIAMQYLKRPIDEESLSWQRFVTHITFLAQRLLQRTDYSAQGDLRLFDMLAQTYPEACACAGAIKDFLETEFRCIIGKEEQSYLAVHISKLQHEYGADVPDTAV